MGRPNLMPGPPHAGWAATTVAFHGSKGGVGTTTLACEMAASLSASHRKVAAVDMDLFRGDLHLRMEVPLSRETYTITDLVPVMDELDDRILDNALSTTAHGVRLLPSPRDSEEASLVGPGHAGALLAALEGEYDHVIVDTAPSLDGVTLAAVSRARLLVLVVIPEISSMSGARRVLDALKDSDDAPGRVSLVVNRALGEADMIGIGEIESFLEVPVSLVLREEAVLCRRAADEGRLLISERSQTGLGLRKLAGLLFRAGPSGPR